jgi:hypothetical protein
MAFTDDLHTLIFSGSLKKGGTWGGPTCAAYVPLDVHYYETIAWILLCFLLYKLLNLSSVIAYIQSCHRRCVSSASTEKSSSSIWSILDGMVLIVTFGLWFQVLYYKIRIQSLVNLLQPCHLSLLWQSLSILLSGRSALSYFLALITLPMTIGAVAALAVPATEGLDQPFEKISFFVQHYVLLVTPLYLLLRQNFNLYKVATFSSVLFSNWFALILHWCIFSVRSHSSYFYSVLNCVATAV